LREAAEDAGLSARRTEVDQPKNRDCLLADLAFLRREYLGRQR
jgi:hypothetical protein